MIEAEDLIKQAYERAGLWPYQQSMQHAQLETGKRLLKGIVSRYNNDDLLVFTQNDFNLDLRGGNIVNVVKEYDNCYIFETQDDVPEEYNTIDKIAVYVWKDAMYYVNVSSASLGYDWLAMKDLNEKFTLNDVEYIAKDYITNYEWLDKHKGEHWIAIDNVTKIRAISSKPNGQILDEYVAMKFVPYDSFKNLSSSANCYTIRETATSWQILFKQTFAKQNRNVIISYNEGFNISDTINISDIYVELLIQGLTVKLCHLYPNDETNTSRQENELANIISNVRTPRANLKMVKRVSYDGYCSTADSLLAGEGLWL